MKPIYATDISNSGGGVASTPPRLSLRGEYYGISNRWRQDGMRRMTHHRLTHRPRLGCLIELR